MALEAAPNFGPHLPEELLEKYAFGRLPQSELPGVEEHLLVCEYCRERLESEDNFAQAMHVLAKVPEQPGKRSAIDRIKSWVSQAPGILSRPSALAATLAVILVAGFALWHLALRPDGNPLGNPLGNRSSETITLAALRGGGEAGMAHASAGRALDLSIDLQEIAEFSPQAGNYRLEVVDTAGAPLWTGAASAAAGKLGARVDRRLTTGMYWVRLYSPTGKLLREFGLQVN
jgi:hypothetical protein